MDFSNHKQLVCGSESGLQLWLYLPGLFLSFKRSFRGTLTSVAANKLLCLRPKDSVFSLSFLCLFCLSSPGLHGTQLDER